MLPAPSPSPATGPGFSPRFEAALTFAALRHAGQVRKGTKAPYLTHLSHVARILAVYGYDEDHEIVALLHDVLEDTCADAAERAAVATEIRDRFGAEIEAAVRALSEPKKGDAGTSMTWPERKRAYLAQLASASPLALRVSAADKLHNLATLLAELEARGPSVWDRFRGGPEESRWFYGAVHALLAERLPDAPLLDELGALVAALDARAEAGTP